MVGSASVLLPGPRTQLSEEKDSVAAVVRSAGDLHRLLEPRQKEGAASRSAAMLLNSQCELAVYLSFSELYDSCLQPI